jgi:hypothetical protein
MSPEGSPQKELELDLYWLVQGHVKVPSMLALVAHVPAAQD